MPRSLFLYDYYACRRDELSQPFFVFTAPSRLSDTESIFAEHHDGQFDARSLPIEAYDCGLIIRHSESALVSRITPNPSTQSLRTHS